MNDLALRIDLPDLEEPFRVGLPLPLTLEDVLNARFKSQAVAKSEVSRIRHSHHEIARLLAAGHKQVEVARMLGRTQVNISILCKNPMFQDLIAYYQESRLQDSLELSSRIRAAASDSLEALQERIDGELEQPGSLNTSDLHKITKDLLDRSGHSPVSRRESRNISIGLSADDIKKIKEDSKQEPIEGTFEEVDEDSDGQ